MRLDVDKLSLGAIADLWARELDEARDPGRISREEMVRRFARQIVEDRFPPGSLSLPRRKTRHLKQHGPIAVSPYKLAYWLNATTATQRNFREAAEQQDTSEFWPTLAKEAAEATSQHLADFVEPIEISRDDFAQYCYKQGCNHPRFWFDNAHAGTTRPKGKQGRKPSSGMIDDNDLLVEIARMIRDGEAASVAEAAKQIAPSAKGGGQDVSKEKRLRDKYRADPVRWVRLAQEPKET